MATPSAAEEAASLHLPGEAATAAFGRALARLARPGDLIALEGDLGAGKTLIARAFINALPGPDGSPFNEEVPSPTFTLVQVYERLPAPVWHFDLYRIERPEEIFELGIEEALAEGISLVEWPQRMGEAFHVAGRLDVQISFASQETARDIRLLGGPAWQERIGVLLSDG